MILNIREILDFFDGRKNSLKGDANALMGLLGEELNASVYKHFRRNSVEVLNDSVLPGTSRGKRLDRWIVDGRKLYQCEIKNWAATAIGGKKLESDADKDAIRKVSQYHFKHEMTTNFSTGTKHPNGVTKVLLKMKPPTTYSNISKIEPLIIFWMPITSDKNGLKPDSTISVKRLKLKMETTFPILHMFSVSLYLRKLYKCGEGNEHIDLDMKIFQHRMKILDSFQK